MLNAAEFGGRGKFSGTPLDSFPQQKSTQLLLLLSEIILCAEMDLSMLYVDLGSAVQINFFVSMFLI